MRKTKRQIKRGRRRARRHLPRRRLPIGPGGLAILAVLVLTIGTAMLLRDRRSWAEVGGLLEYARTRQLDPVSLAVAAGRSRRMVFLGDVHSSAEPKRIAAETIEVLARRPGLDAVVLEVDADQQPYIDRYLESDPENTSILFAHPRTLREHWGASRDYLEIYRRVWRLNRALGPGRRIRIIAADLPGWPPAQPLPPRAAAVRYARRDAFMAELVEREILDGNPRARVLIFMGGYHALKGGHAALHFGGGSPVAVTWLATRLHQEHPGEIFTILVDGGPRPTGYGFATSYGSTRIFDLFRKHLPRATAPFGLVVNDRFDFVSEPIYETRTPELDLSIGPDGYRLQEVIDGYIYLGVARGVNFLR